MNNVLHIDPSVNRECKITQLDRFHNNVGKVLPFEDTAQREYEFLINDFEKALIDNIFQHNQTMHLERSTDYNDIKRRKEAMLLRLREHEREKEYNDLDLGWFDDDDDLFEPF